MTSSVTSSLDVPDRILVTGGAGFIGSELVRQLAALGAQVAVVDNLVNGKRENLSGVLSERVTLETADIRDESRMAELMKGIDAVYHLACLGVRHSIHAPAENHAVNAGASLSLLTLARESGVDRFVYVSTSEVYGTARNVPMTEEHVTFPMTVYGAGKLAGECYARAFFETHGFPTVMVRPFNAFGPRSHHEGDSGEVIPKFLLNALAGRPMVIFGDGSQTRDFTYVSDTARGILLAGLHPRAVGRTINLGSGREISINALADTVAALLDLPNAPRVHDDPRPGDVLRLFADTTLAGRLLGFESTVSLGEGLAHLRDWYAQGEQTPEKLLEDEVVHNWRSPGGALP